MISVLRQRNFGLLWLGGLLSLIGDWAFYSLTPVFVLDRTDSVFLSGLVWTLSALPMVLVGPFVGVYVDRHSRQRIMVWTAIAQSMAMAALLIVGGGIGIWFAMGIILIEAILATIYFPAENALLPMLVPEQDRPTANALNALNDNIARIVGPFLGVALYAWIDIRGAALANLVSFSVAAILIGLVVTPPTERNDPHSAEHPPLLSSMREGIGYVWRSPMLRTLFLIQILVSTADGPLTAMLTPFIRRTVDGSAGDVGLILSIRGVAGVIGGVLVAQLAGRIRSDRTLGASLPIVGVLVVALAGLREVWQVALVMLLIGPVVVAMNTVLPTLLQNGSEDAWRGRLFSLNFALIGGTFAASTLVGSALGGVTSPPTMLITSGIIYMVAGGVAFLRRSDLRPVAVTECDEGR